KNAATIASTIAPAAMPIQRCFGGAGCFVGRSSVASFKAISPVRTSFSRCSSRSGNAVRMYAATSAAVAPPAVLRNASRAAAIACLGHAEVEHLHHARVEDDDVRRRDVAMHDLERAAFRVA